MTLIEVLVALTILGLAVGAALSFLGPWIDQERRLEREARFWRDAQVAQTAVSELVAGVVDPARSVQVVGNTASLETYAPRLWPTPTRVDLRVAKNASGDQLILSDSALRGAPSILLADGVPLRLRALTGIGGLTRTIVVEGYVAKAWSPAVVAPLATDAVPICVFDIISQRCR
jgi:prepilin-type N-terminal cleavage/methylation domain-containing protein